MEEEEAERKKGRTRNRWGSRKDAGEKCEEVEEDVEEKGKMKEDIYGPRRKR